MGTLNFLLPPDLPASVHAELERASIAGGQEHMPYHTQATLQNGQLSLARTVQESGHVLSPWDVPGYGRLLLPSATLMERPAPYHLAKELARGTINHVRCQTAEWIQSGLAMRPNLDDYIREATHAFGKTLISQDADETTRLAQEALVLGCRAAEELVATYARQVFQIRHQRLPRLETLLGCRLTGVPRSAEMQRAVADTFNAAVVHVPWNVIEPSEGNLHWQPFDDVIDFVQGNGQTVLAGPLIDFSGYGLPDWLWAKELDLTLRCDYMSEFIDRIVLRYKGRVKHWQLTAGSNLAGVVARSEDELLWLTLRLIETARQTNADAEYSVGLAQPFGDYLAVHEQTNSPLAFADALLRTGVKLTALELEFIMGLDPRGSYCRHSLDFSRIIDLYSYLGIPLLLTVGYPSDSQTDPIADKEPRATAGYWHSGFSSECQAEWVDQFVSLGLAKPMVRGVMWSDFDDGLPHQFPHVGLVDAQGNPRPALQRMLDLRREHLK